MQHIYTKSTKSENLLMQHNISMNCSFSYQKKINIIVLLHYFIVQIGSKVSQLLHSSIILKIFSKPLTPRKQRKLVLTRFNFENILSSLALETGTVNNILIINSTSLESLLLGDAKIFHHVSRYETPAGERVFFAYSTNS